MDTRFVIAISGSGSWRRDSRGRLFEKLDSGVAHRPLSYVAKGLVVGFLMAVAGGFLAAATGMAPLPWILTGVLTGVIVLASGRLLSARTVIGARTLAKVPMLKPDCVCALQRKRPQKLGFGVWRDIFSGPV
jgi:hypothetical protein